MKIFSSSPIQKFSNPFEVFSPGLQKHLFPTIPRRIGRFALALVSLTSFCITKKNRVNEGIRVPTVRLIGANDEQIGIRGIEEARRMALEAGLDLVEVAPNVNPPVCKIMDFGKFVYKLNKLAQKQRARQKKHEIKGIRLSVRTDKHDLETKIKKAREFLGDGHSLKVTLIFKGREIAHSDFALEKMITMRDALVDVAKVDQEPKKQGYNLFMVLSPINH
ncbi:MAG: translation initiation factor IF-3 [Candidatus Gracilibacteria bacterium]